MTSDIFTAKARVFDCWAPSYDGLFTSVFYQAVHQRLLTYVQFAGDEPQSVLDIGCGTGKLLNRLAAQFPALQGTGLDLSTQMLRQARRKNQYRPRLIFVQGTSQAMPFAQDQFQAAFSTISFLHYPQPQPVFQEVSRVLQPQGRFYLVDYIPFWGCGRQQTWKGMGGPMFLYSLEDRETLGVDAGLTCKGHYALLGLVWLSIFEKPNPAPDPAALLWSS
ncbi:MAG: class I SAM-dependent methyltransferase [Acaryochloris sp. RU_4_1]|nr:class I SAM-dependent methyltransferase [Acaryochloris sp. RU_4_1]